MHHIRLGLKNKSAIVSNLLNIIERGDKSFYIRCNESCGLKSRNVSVTSNNRFSDSKDDSRIEKDVTSEKASPVGGNKSADAKAKLGLLLKSIVQESKDAAEKKSQEKDKMIDMKLAAPVRTKKRPIQTNVVGKTPEDIEAEKDLGEEMVEAVRQVAETVGDGDTKAVESELVQKLKTSVGKKVDMKELFAGMKIDRTTKSTPSTSAVDMDLSRAHRVRRLLDERSTEPAKHRDMQANVRQRRPPPTTMSYVPIDLFGGPPLGIFTDTERSSKISQQSQANKLETWDALHRKDLKLAVTHPPANGFEEMILWTEQGKLWKFPIDNEQGMEEEAKVPFHEHVFLEPQIESWCPKKGPIRHFMELVCVGLSKNPFLTVNEKHTQLEWYHQYFKNKAAIIKDVGAGEIK